MYVYRYIYFPPNFMTVVMQSYYIYKVAKYSKIFIMQQYSSAELEAEKSFKYSIPLLFEKSKQHE